LRIFYHGGSLYYGQTLLMVLLTLVGSFMALTGIILHSIARIMLECKSELVTMGRTSQVQCQEAEKRSEVRSQAVGKVAKDN